MITKIYGAPGTGKTTKLLDILVQEIKSGVPLRNIAFVTHTVAARDEAKARAKKLVASPDKDAFRFFRTIHGICFREIGLEKQQVIQHDDYLAFADRVGIPFTTNYTDELDEDGLPAGFNTSPGNSILAVRQLAAARQVSIEDIRDSWPAGHDGDTIRGVIGQYIKYKKDLAKFDFVDMLQLYVEEGDPLDARVVIVDEAQDLSSLQWKIIERFSQNSERVFIGGDDDQSIYGFIGSDPHGFLRHRADCDIVLPRSYRLKRRIFEHSQDIIQQVAERRTKDVAYDGEGGIVEWWNRPANYLKFGEGGTTMLVARHHKQLSKLSALLKSMGASYSHRGNSLVGTPRSLAIYNYRLLQQGGTLPIREALAVAGYTRTDRMKALRASARDFPDTAMDAKAFSKETGLDLSEAWHKAMAKTKWDERKNEQLALVISQSGWDAIKESPKIDLTTYHACKGREADHVVLFTDVYKSAWDQRYSDDETRLSYVGVTRAREKLTIVLPETEMYMRALV